MSAEKELMKQQRSYNKELKAEAVKMCLEQGQSQEEVSRRLSIPAGTIGSWIVAAKKDFEPAQPGDRSVQEILAENTRQRKDLAGARMLCADIYTDPLVNSCRNIS
jgi:transposase-like protein